MIQTALAEETRIASKMLNDTEMELYKRNFEIKKAAYDMEVETARAQAELAFQLQVQPYFFQLREHENTYLSSFEIWSIFSLTIKHIW